MSSRTFGRLAYSPGNANLVGSITDSATGEQVPAKVQVINAAGHFVHPDGAILKVGTGDPFFYSDGSFEVNVSRGWTQVIVERGTEYLPARVTVEAPSRGAVAVDVVLERWTDLGDRGWHPGNTHIHYDEKEERPDDRLWLDPRVEDLRMTAISVLKRWDFDYASNKYPPGMLTEFSSAHHYVQSGEENRHNGVANCTGYGHVMLLNIRNVIEPVSRGMLVDAFDPDYPPLSYACDDAHRQGGIVIWCHNGHGMEAPVAAALGKLDAFNLFDPQWTDLEYDVYYRMLNAGIRLPASTGSDWFISSANRVYAQTDGPFDYDQWLSALKGGKTFITNGPALSFLVDGHGPGEEIQTAPGTGLMTSVSWKSHYPVGRVEVLFNGNVVAHESYPEGSTGGQLEADVVVPSDGWVAARLSSDHRDSYDQPVFAHTSPVYVACGTDGPEKGEAAVGLDDAIERSLDWVGTKGKYYSGKQRKEIVDLFREGQQVYRAMLK